MNKASLTCLLLLLWFGLKARYKYGLKPMSYDAFTRMAWPSTPVADPVVRKNRQLLIAEMERHGFRVNSSEWWHFDFVGWREFEVLDIDFSEF